MDWSSWLTGQQIARRNENLERRAFAYSGRQGSDLLVGKTQLLNFSSNDYLGLAGHPVLSACLAESASLYGVGSGASHLVCGHSEIHHQLELALAAFVGAERALLLSSGYMANVGLPQALTGRDDLIVSDRLNHASLIDGIRLSRAIKRRYQHGDVEHAQYQADQQEFSRCLVVTDGVFSMDGDTAPIRELRQFAGRNNGLLLIDDAHGLGVIGSGGRGSLCVETEKGKAADFNNVLLMGTLGKAFGCFGAFVAGNTDVIEHISQTCRSYIYTTALPPAMAACAISALELMEQGDLLNALHENIEYFKNKAKQYGLPILKSDSAIQVLLLGGNDIVLQAASILREKGFLVGAIRPPTVPEGTARLRITLSSTHTVEQIDKFLTELKSALETVA
jgi:8-amino-7-oxononanoate synthase